MNVSHLGWYMNPINEYIKSMKWVYKNQIDVSSGNMRWA